MKSSYAGTKGLKTKDEGAKKEKKCWGKTSSAITMMSGTLSGQLTSLPPHLHPIALVSIVNMHYTTKNILAFWIDALAAMSIVTPSLVVLPSPTATTFGSSIAVVKG